MDTHKKSNLGTTHNHQLPRRLRRDRNPTIPATSSQDFKKTHEEFLTKNLERGCDVDHHTVVATVEGDDKAEEASTVVEEEEESGRERLKRHRVEMSGRVWIPDLWGQEDLMKKWIDSTVFDSCVEKNSITLAREALIQEGRSTLSIENSC